MNTTTAPVIQSMVDRSTTHAESWLVYDGACPVCDRYALWVRLRRSVGALHLVDARQRPELVSEFSSRGLDADEGIAFIVRGTVYFGADAVWMLTLLGSGSRLSARLATAFFGGRRRSHWFYPFAKAARRIALRICRIPPIGAVRT